MAIALNTVIVDGQEYKPGDVIPDFKSIKCVDTREPRKYQGLSADVSVLNDVIAKYASGGASCFMSDTGEYYEYDRKEKTFKLITNITERGFGSEKAYGALKHMLKNVSVSDEKIQSAVTDYLRVNPVLPGATTEQAQQIEQNKTDIGSLKEDLGEKGTTLTDIQKKMSDSNSNDGFLLCDLNGNIVGHIASFEVWNNEPYNKKYGWGGHPYGDGKLPPYSKIAGVFEADLLSVCGGKGRWNKDDTGNFQHGGHLFEGWNAEEDARLTFGIGTKNKDISWIQTFHAATQEGSDSGAYYCVTKVGSDIDNQGMNFMPSITQSRSLFSLKVGNNLAPKTEHIQKLVETGELTNWEYNATDMVPYGTMYFDYDKDKVRVYTRTGGWKYLKFEEEV
jgi:hypothetical protein